MKKLVVAIILIGSLLVCDPCDPFSKCDLDPTKPTPEATVPTKPTPLPTVPIDPR